MTKLNRIEKFFLLFTVLFVILISIAHFTLGFTAPPLPPRDSAAPTQPYLININTASAAELDELPYIGEAIAQRIITYREENGPFETIDELDNVSGITPNRINAFRDRICV